MRTDHSDLEVVPNDTHGLHVVVSPSGGKNVIPDVNESDGYKIWTGRDDEWINKETRNTQEAGERSAGQRQGRIWDRRTKYWIIAIVSILIIAAAVGGGVGGALSNRKDQSNAHSSEGLAAESQTSNAEMATSATPATSSTATITTSTIAEPSATHYRDCPSSNNTIYSVQNGDSEPILFRKFCNESLVTGGNSALLVNVGAQSLDDCIGLCVAYNTQNKTMISEGQSQPCNTVCWRNGASGDDLAYQCFGSTTLNSTGEFRVQNETICDSAAWINQVL